MKFMLSDTISEIVEHSGWKITCLVVHPKEKVCTVRKATCNVFMIDNSF